MRFGTRKSLSGLGIIAFAPVATIVACGASEMAIEDAVVGNWACTRVEKDTSGTVSVSEDGTFSVDGDILVESDREGTWAINGGSLIINARTGIEVTTVPATVTPGDSADLEFAFESGNSAELQVSISDTGVASVFAGPAGPYQSTSTCERL